MNESNNARRRVPLNALYSATSWLLPILISFVATPILVRALGHEGYGLYALVLGFIGYSFAFGIGKAAAKYVAEFRSGDRSADLSDAVSATFWLSVSIGIFGTLVLIIAAPWLVSDVLSVGPENNAIAVRALWIASLVIFGTLISQVFQSILQGLHRFDRVLLISNSGNVILNVGNIALVLNGHGLLALVGWNLAVVVLLGALYLISAKSLLPELKIKLKIDPNVKRTALRYGTAIIASQIFGNVLLIFERTWIVRSFGTESLTYYVVPMMLTLFIHGFVSSIVLVIFPLLNEHLGSIENVDRIYRSATRLILAIIFPSVVSVFVVGRLFLSSWLGDDFANRSFTILTTHSITFGLLAAVTNVWQVAESFGRANLNAVFSAIWLLIGGGLMIFLPNSLGIEGVAVARLIGIVAALPVFILVEAKLLKGLDVWFWFSTIWRLFVASLIMWIAQIFCISVISTGWLSLISASLLGTAVFGSVIYLLDFFSDEERNILKSFLNRK